MQTINLSVLHALLVCTDNQKRYCNGPYLWPRLTTFVGSRAVKRVVKNDIKRIDEKAECVCKNSLNVSRIKVLFSRSRADGIHSSGTEGSKIEGGSAKGQGVQGGAWLLWGVTNILCVTRANIFLEMLFGISHPTFSLSLPLLYPFPIIFLAFFWRAGSRINLFTPTPFVITQNDYKEHNQDFCTHTQTHSPQASPVDSASKFIYYQPIARWYCT